VLPLPKATKQAQFIDIYAAFANISKTTIMGDFPI
jgi:hypothetical protein